MREEGPWGTDSCTHFSLCVRTELNCEIEQIIQYLNNFIVFFGLLLF